MLKKIVLTGFICALLTVSLSAQNNQPKAAGKIMKQAYALSKKTDKNVLLIFHASWCTWCKRLDKAMESNELKKIFDDNFVVTHLDILERGDAVAKFENKGGNELFKKMGAGEKTGVPFMVMLDKKGKKLADSNVMPDNGNIGYPGTDEEITAFMKIIKVGAPKMTDDDYNTIAKYLKDNAPKQ